LTKTASADPSMSPWSRLFACLSESSVRERAIAAARTFPALRRRFTSSSAKLLGLRL
jgi:hypothetical protein